MVLIVSQQKEAHRNCGAPLSVVIQSKPFSNSRGHISLETDMCSARRIHAGMAWLLGLLICAAAVGPVWAQKSVGDEIGERLQLAQKLQQQGEVIRATSELRQALGLTLEQLGLIYDSLGNLDKASAAYSAAIETKSDSNNSLLGLAIVCLKKREFEKGIETVKLLLAQNPFHPAARHLLGKLYFAMGRLDAAVSELDEAARLAPGDNTVASALAIVYLKQKRLENARKTFRRMIENLGESAQLHIFFGAVYRQSEYFEEAEAEFKQTISLNPRYPRAHYYLGLSYLSQEGRNKSSEAIAEFQIELQRDPNDYLSNYLLGLVYLSDRRLEQAVPHLEKAWRVEPQKPDAPLYLGQSLCLMGQEAKGVPILKVAIQLTSDPSRNQYQIAKAHYLLSQSFRREGNLPEATAHADLAAQYKAKAAKSDVERIQSFLKTGPEDISTIEGMNESTVIVPRAAPGEMERARLEKIEKIYARIAGSAYNQLGLLSASQNDFKRAAKYFERANDWDSDVPDIDYNLGLAQFKAEQFRQALVALERAQKKQPERMPVRVLLGLSCFSVDDYACAVQQLSPLADSGVDDPQVMFAFGLSLANTGNRERGRQILSNLLKKYPRIAEIHLAMGRLYALEADYSSAGAEFSEALEVDPTLSDAHYYAGLALLRQTKFSEAADEFRREIERNPQHAKAQYHLGFALSSLQRIEEAITRFEEAIRLDPAYADAHYELAKIRLQQNLIEAATSLLETVVKLDPNKSYGYYQLSQAYQKAGRQPAAEAAMSRYRELKARERGTSP
jgi:tetratricopeptide (TPR) repeat protein